MHFGIVATTRQSLVETEIEAIQYGDHMQPPQKRPKKKLIILRQTNAKYLRKFEKLDVNGFSGIVRE